MKNNRKSNETQEEVDAKLAAKEQSVLDATEKDKKDKNTAAKKLTKGVIRGTLRQDMEAAFSDKKQRAVLNKIITLCEEE